MSALTNTSVDFMRQQVFDIAEKMVPNVPVVSHSTHKKVVKAPEPESDFPGDIPLATMRRVMKQYLDEAGPLRFCPTCFQYEGQRHSYGCIRGRLTLSAEDSPRPWVCRALDPVSGVERLCESRFAFSQDLVAHLLEFHPMHPTVKIPWLRHYAEAATRGWPKQPTAFAEPVQPVKALDRRTITTLAHTKVAKTGSSVLDTPAASIEVAPRPAVRKIRRR